MNKLLLFFVGALLAAPVSMANDTDLHLCRAEGSASEGFKPGLALGTARVNYSEQSDIYTITDFLGYPGTTLKFKPTWNKDYKHDSEKYTHPNGTKIVYLQFFLPDPATDPFNALCADGNSMMRMDYTKYNGMITDGKSYDLQSDIYSSMIFEGDGVQYKICLHDIWCVQDETPEEIQDDVLRHTYAGRNAAENLYIFYMHIKVGGRWMRTNENEDWTYQNPIDNPEAGWDYMLVLPYLDWGYKASYEPAGIQDVIIDNNAPVEYFNIQGMRVENPEKGLYIRRQGAKVTKVIMP